MLRFRLHELKDTRSGHILGDLLPGDYLCAGGLAFTKPGERSHTNDGPGGLDIHTHPDREAFIIIQGYGIMEVDGVEHVVTTGDVLIIEAGEDHHLRSSEDDPLVTLWCHAGHVRHKSQAE
ncbi:cupin domain-containing protein [Paenibacillus lactis]|uniref:cupin domain-containing protein n=1 Tax=Paenibacillus lactis TaxID=228574 RepID=UPI001B24BF4A|nr:cupin domain-containing protein [Paenibacillus lactis]GIO92409.1 hypothetical protein J31TS3_36360 [Paenibacillus lactis]